MSRQTEPITIVEIRKRAEQGVTLPFYCRGDDDKWYWVKGNRAGKRALCCEWLAGRIGKAFNLPIPPFAQVLVPQEIIDYSAMNDIRDLGAGLCFGSQNVPDASEFTMANISSVDDAFKLRLLIFDWWIKNGDRTLGPQGGNVNLLWTPADSSVHVIDHNIAFDDDLDVDRFNADHVFAGNLEDLRSMFTLEMQDKMREIAAQIEDFWNELPEAWTEEGVLPTAFSLNKIKNVIVRFSEVSSLFGGEIR
jgi:hypothetical protein